MTNVVQIIKSTSQARKMNEGFILFYRSIQEQEWYNVDLPRTMLFNYCLLNASHTIYESSFRGKTVLLEAGQLHATYKVIANESGIFRLYEQYLKSKDPLGASKKAINKCLDLFTKDGTLSYIVLGEGRLKSTVITISNWAKFQALPVTKTVTQLVTKDNHTQHAVESRKVTQLVTQSVTKNNNTLSKDRVKDTCSEQGSEPEKKLTNIVLPLNKKNTFYTVAQEDFDEYLEIYPAVDVLQQLRLMYRWLKDNPKRKKTKAGIQRFISSWLGKEQNKSSSYKAKKDIDPNDTSWADGLVLTK